MQLMAIHRKTVSTRTQGLALSAIELMDESKAKATKEAYKADQEQFREFCAEDGFPAFCDDMTTNMQAVGLWLAHLERRGLKYNTIIRKYYAVKVGHDDRGAPFPALRQSEAKDLAKMLKGLRRRLGVRGEPRKALSTAELTLMVNNTPENMKGLRDRALLLIGFAGGFRRSELAALTVAELTETAQGLEILVKSSKTDQEGKGFTKKIARGSVPLTCPVRALNTWLQAAGIESGPIFRAVNKGGRVINRAVSGRAIAYIVKEAASAAKLDPTRVSGHSLRSGFATEAHRNGARFEDVMAQGGWIDERTVGRYIQRRNTWDDPASAHLGL